MRFGSCLAAVPQGVAASACYWGEGRQYRSDAASATCKQERGGDAAILENIYGYQRVLAAIKCCDRPRDIVVWHACQMRPR